MSVQERLQAVRARIRSACERSGRDPAAVRLVGVVKGVPAATVREAAAAGLADVGENYVQEANERRKALGEAALSLSWHFIGHLQTNKAPVAAQRFDMIHSVDSLRLAKQLDSRASARLPVLLEVNVAGEASKSGFSPKEVGAAVAGVSELPNLELQGLMTIAPAVSNPEEVRHVFRELRHLAEANGLPHLSMGMTDDFEVAIEEGATIVRIGRAIFGERSA
ncbi:MAG TPA: YggS family pyridoxal phosphate-dependent enzyme [Dehalococcoidia bacterium]|nr:YggS family pyridoxal phosphate-dependent enzyme [Dehalococcoidia bacterium]